MKNYYLLLFLLFGLFGKAQIINFPDANFKAKLLEATSSNGIAINLSGNSIKIDLNNNAEIEVSEALVVYKLYLENYDVITGSTSVNSISSLDGIDYFVNLKLLNCSNNSLTTIDLNLPNLTNLDCSYNTLPSLNINLPNFKSLNCSSNLLTSLIINNPNLMEELDYSHNQIPNLNLPQFHNLKVLNCSNNQITTLNLSNLINLSIFSCSNNFLTNLDLISNINLTRIYCNNNSLTSIILPENPNGIEILDCSFNQFNNLTITKIFRVNCNNNLLTHIDFLHPEVINAFKCKNNLFTELDLGIFTNYNITSDVDISNNPNLVFLSIKNGRHNIIGYSSIAGTLFFENCPNLRFICIDDLPFEIAYIQNRINSYGYTNINFNSYCSFVPGGEFYNIQGQQKLDSNNDGCDSNDLSFPTLKFNITTNTTTSFFISDNSGNYSIPVQAGTHTITPILEYPSYFNVSPTNVVVNFPTQTSPFTQDFCISPNGIKHDVEVSIVPISVARAGFNCNYQIIYKNKGNQVENGTISLAFDDTILDLVSTNVATSSQTFGNLNWNYTTLQPFETRSINVALNLNSPIESPAVNSGDILNYTTTNTITNTDEMLSDNTFALNQTVVNSYDPNDKTCLEGNSISPDRVGGFVHYMIRFENTGTFPAENIVVKDMIDTAKFDVSSLVPLNASHNYFTKITGNKVEFIFENINLPFDNANNDGYIAFKIKTLPSLVIGNTFSNSANIYFDYNFPIDTNTATTTIAALSNPSFEFSNYFSLYPNPTANELNINLKSAIEINSIQIYNTIGQLVTVQTGNALKVDVSNLKTGNYFIKINTIEGFSTSQFIKE
jgi:hypothetical protein